MVADNAVIAGAGDAAELTETLSKVAVAKLELLWLLTASPMYTFCAIVIVWLDCSSVQTKPLAEIYALNTFPARTSFTQYGNPGMPVLP